MSRTARSIDGTRTSVFHVRRDVFPPREVVSMLRYHGIPLVRVTASYYVGHYAVEVHGTSKRLRRRVARLLWH
jgi:hypothetical protein